MKIASVKPRHAIRAVCSFPFHGKSPVDLGLPWISYGAIDWLEHHVSPETEILEFGSGGSTLFFGRRSKFVYSKESHAEWHELVALTLIRQSITNVMLELCELREEPNIDYLNHPYFKLPKNRSFDLVLVDGFCGFQIEGGHALRNHSFTCALEALRPGGHVLLDDSWLYPELMSQYRANLVTDFVSFGPCRYGVTSTALFRF